MIKKVSLLTFLFCTALSTLAQEYTVKSMKHKTDDQSAVEHKRFDINNEPCALIKVLAADKVVKVDGNVIGDVERHGSFSWIYVTDGTNRIDINFENHLSLSIPFSEYGIRKVTKEKTYVLLLTEKASNQQIIVERDTTNGQGMYELGLDYTTGTNGKQKDDNKAFYWFQKSANSDNANGINSLGFFYKNGRVVSKDPEKAIKYFQEAMAKGSEKAYYNMGTMYESGEGVTKDFAKALELYEKSGTMAEYATGQYAAGRMYYYGRGTQCDYKKAMIWFEKAAHNGSANAQSSLGDCYFYGEGTDQDYVKAVEWYKKAADQKTPVPW